jgi:hypothetical protein
LITRLPPSLVGPRSVVGTDWGGCSDTTTARPELSTG